MLRAVVRGTGNPIDLPVWSLSSDAMQRHLERDQTFPSFFLAQRDLRPKATRPYDPLVGGREPRYDELCYVSDVSTVYYPGDLAFGA
jgi:hypothetical protein